MGDALFKRVFEAAKVGMLILEGDAPRDANPALVAMTGRPAENLISHTHIADLLREVTHADDAEAAIAWVGEQNDPRAARDALDVRVVRPDGAIHWWQLSLDCLTPAPDACSLLTVVDVSAQHQPSNQLRILWRAIEHSPASIVITDRRGVIEYVNPKFTSLTGYTAEEARGKRPSILTTPFTPSGTHRDLWRTVLAGHEWRGEFINRRKDGQLFRELASISPVKDDNGTITHFVAVKEDITERHEALRRLRESEARYRLLAENVNDVIWVMNPQGSLLFISPSVERLRGYTAEEAIGQTLADIFVPEVVEEVRALFAAFLEHAAERSSEVLRFETRYAHKDGSTVWVEIVARALYEDDALQGIIGTTRDISKRKTYEREREQLIADLDAFAHTVAHDIKSPVTSIYGFADFLIENQGNLRPGELEKSITYIHETSLKLASIVDELLRFASVSSLEQVATAPVDMAAVVGEALARLAPKVQAREAQVVQTLTGWPTVMSYAAWVEEVWVNYISNAIKYGGTPPQVTLGASEEGDGMARFWVRDNGRGLTPAEQAQLFTSPVRLDPSLADGNGLGLPIVQRIVHKLGGRVGVQSTPGEGSTFFFTLPLA